MRRIYAPGCALMIYLLFGEDTIAGVSEPDQWHGQLQEFIEQH